MSWTRIKRPLTTRDVAAVEIACRRASERKPGGLYFVLRTALLTDVPFLRRGARIDVLLGEGEAAGKIRLEHGVEFPLVMIGRSNSTNTLVLNGVPMPPGVPATARASERAEFTCGAGWIEVTLPRWAMEPPPVLSATSRAAPAPAAVPPPRQPYSLSERVPDPATALRGGARR